MKINNHIPNEIVIIHDDDNDNDNGNDDNNEKTTRNSVHDELLTGDVDVHGRYHQHQQQDDSAPPEELFRPPTHTTGYGTSSEG
mmetsp:Transcript_7261/g.8309  ORF Transcript_7261/g.8309 Transcript_7261/m.8309 type:complete len:84 (+) Transcript_7261:324-575(+)